MPAQPIIFGNRQESGDERLAGASPVAVNVVVDGKGTVRRRPGVASTSRTKGDVIDTLGIDGIHVTNGGRIYAVGGQMGPSRKVYHLTATTTKEFTGPESTLLGSGRPVFAETEALVVIAGGDDMIKVVLDGDTISKLGGSPPKASHVTANSLRLEANDLVVDRSKVRYSGVATGSVFTGHEDWALGGIGLAGFFSAEARPDPVQAIGENTNELFVFGSTNVQIFTPDAALVYAPVSTREYGLVAPYSVIKVDQAFAWLDHRRRFVVSDGRTFEVISDGIEATLDTIADPSDCFGYRVHEGPIDCLVWTFPGDGRTFAYQRQGGWSQWQGRNEGANQWKQLPITALAHDQNTDDNLVGTSDGKVGVLLMGETKDFDEDIVAYVESGFYSRGTDRRKHCVSVRLTFERGEAVQPTEEPVAFLSYADAPDKWSNPRPIKLGADGDTRPVVVFRSLGVYRRRAWRLQFSADVDLVLAGVEEEFEVLEQ